MKKFNICLCAFLSLIGLTFLSSSVYALQSGDFYYTVSNSTVTITGITSLACQLTPTEVIPSVINGMPVVAIRYEAFYNCTGLTSVTIPDSVTSIGGGVFDNCSGLTAIVVDPNNAAYSSLDGVLYNKAKTALILYPEGRAGGFIIPNSVTSIGGAFFNCTRLTSVTIPNGVMSIGDLTFFYCASLTSIIIPDSVMSIGYKAFFGCSSLTTAKFIGNAPSMGVSVFASCASNFSVCYTAGATGFTTPNWCFTNSGGLKECYPASVCGATLIELSSFTATPKASEVILQWTTESETENAGFNLYRAEAENGEYIKINNSLIPAKGSSSQGATYEFIDKDVKNRKTYYYKLEDIDLNGNETMHGPVSAMPRLIYGVGK